MTEWGIDTLFNPGKRHMDDEKRRLQTTREEIGDSSGGRRIDLENGKVVIARKKPTAPSVESNGEDAADEAVGGTAADGSEDDELDGTDVDGTDVDGTEVGGRADDE